MFFRGLLFLSRAHVLANEENGFCEPTDNDRVSVFRDRSSAVQIRSVTYILNIGGEHEFGNTNFQCMVVEGVEGRYGKCKKKSHKNKNPLKKYLLKK